MDNKPDGYADPENDYTSFDCLHDAVDEAPHGSITKLIPYKNLSPIYVVAQWREDGMSDHREFATENDAMKFVANQS